MSPEAQIALYGLLVTIFALLVTAGNYVVQKALNKSVKVLESELGKYREKAPTPDIVAKLFDDNRELATQKTSAEVRANQLERDVRDRDAEIQHLTSQRTVMASQMTSPGSSSGLRRKRRRSGGRGKASSRKRWPPRAGSGSVPSGGRRRINPLTWRSARPPSCLF
jgi:hypothetical protein